MYLDEMIQICFNVIKSDEFQLNNKNEPTLKLLKGTYSPFVIILNLMDNSTNSIGLLASFSPYLIFY